MRSSAFIAVLILISCLNPTTEVCGERYDSYTFSLRLDTDEHILYGQMIFEYHNRADVTHESIYFHIYPNALLPRAVKINWVRDGRDRSLSHRVEGVDNTVLKVDLAEPLPPGGRLTVKMSFQVKIPNVGDRFGYSRDVYCLGNALPIASVYDEQGWNNDPYFPYGESFYSEFAYYSVDIRVKSGYTVAATGRLTETVDNGDGTKTWRWETDLVREFVFVAGKNFRVAERIADGIHVYSYYLQGHESAGIKALTVAVNAIKQFNKHFAKYPYKDFRVVEAPFEWFGGMEYPGLVMIASNLYTYQGEIFELVVAHETAHQWWYATIANDEHDEPWLDEAFAEYSEVLYYEWVYGWERAYGVYASIKSDYESYAQQGGREYPLNSTVEDFKSGTEYYRIIYSKGAVVLHMLRKILGDDLFFNILKEYAEERMFKITRIRDFKQVAEDISGVSLEWFFQDWINYPARTSYMLSDVYYYELNGYVLHFKISQTDQNLETPVIIEVETTTGEEEYKVWVNSSQVEYYLAVGSKPISLTVDPGNIVPGVDFSNKASNIPRYKPSNPPPGTLPPPFPPPITQPPATTSPPTTTPPTSTPPPTTQPPTSPTPTTTQPTTVPPTSPPPTTQPVGTTLPPPTQPPTTTPAPTEIAPSEKRSMIFLLGGVAVVVLIVVSTLILKVKGKREA